MVVSETASVYYAKYCRPNSEAPWPGVTPIGIIFGESSGSELYRRTVVASGLPNISLFIRIINVLFILILKTAAP